MVIFFKSHQALEHIKPYLSETPIIIEAGAFNGRDTQKLAATWPAGTIHAFEPVPELFALLQKNTAHLPNVHCYQLALSHHNGIAPFHVSEKPHKPGVPSQAGALDKPKERLLWSSIHFPTTITVPTITLDTWADQYSIDRIDFAWLDMQGHELNVLQASPRLISTLSAIYMEVNFIEAYENQPSFETIQQWAHHHNFNEKGRTFNDQTSWFFGNIFLVKNN